ncbi:MAG: hypothetical protein ACLQLG_17425 [Thermoguttaceae bacterium]
MNRGTRFAWALLTLAALTMLLPGGGSSAAMAAPVEATLNGLHIVLDENSGVLLRLSHPGAGTILDTTPAAAGLVDLSQPGERPGSITTVFARRSKATKITKTADAITIHWDRFGGHSAGGAVAATVTLKAAPDGRSVSMSCSIDNRSPRPVTQILFPDLVGLAPISGAAPTEVRCGGCVMRPFAELRPSPPVPLEGNPGVTRLMAAAGVWNRMIVRWIDYGSLRGGLSLFSRQWGFQPPMVMMLHLWETNKKLRMVFPQAVTIAAGKQWQSGEYWLTPHAAGWAKGIEPYRAWVGQNIKRVVPLPEHVRRGLGFRTVWLSRYYPDDPQDANWTFADLPKLAKEAKEHGLDEMVVWGPQEGFLLPLPPFYKHLGGDEGFVRAVAECKRLGVNVAPFISVFNAKEKTAARYGLKAVGSLNWTFHPEFIPRFQPPYADAYSCVQIDSHNPIWQREVRASCRRLVDMGIPSLSWDQYIIEPPEPNVLTLTRQICDYSRQRDPQSTFSAEEFFAMEVSCDYLDYTWNWNTLKDCRAVTSAFPTPRVNLNVDASPADVKWGFALNRYLNVQPRKADGANGTDWIANHRELSQALKQCARLRAAFLPYFTEGTLIGECILSEPCPGALVAAYVLPGKVLVIVVNTSDKARAFDLACDPQPWLPSASGGYEAKHYDGTGAMVQSAKLDRASRHLTTGVLEKGGISLFEVLLR